MSEPNSPGWPQFQSFLDQQIAYMEGLPDFGVHPADKPTVMILKMMRDSESVAKAVRGIGKAIYGLEEPNMNQKLEQMLSSLLTAPPEGKVN